MAMINCPECGKEISDNAKSCPNCGYSLKKSFKKKSKKGIFISIAIIVIVAAVAVLVE